MRKADPLIRSGIKQNAMPFSLLIVINLFVGAMVGLERSILPLLAEEQFGLASASAALSFIVSFGLSKAVINLAAGHLADRVGRVRVLVIGWAVGLAVPIMIIAADAWWIIVAANVLLGVNQGLTWSMTVNMKIDLADTRQRGLAVGLNEFAGYTGVALMAAFTGYIATSYSLRPEPFYFGIMIAVIGLILSIFIKDTVNPNKLVRSFPTLSAWDIFQRTTWKNKSLSSVSMAGLSTNLKDGMIWGLLPLYLLTKQISLGEVGIVSAVYPAAWGCFQLITGGLSDIIGRKRLITYGLWLQSAALLLFLYVHTFEMMVASALLLGLGTAMVYPTLAAVVSDVADQTWRATALGVFRFWRDSGYAFGAVIAGVITDTLSIEWAFGLVAAIPVIAGIVTLLRLDETR